jgi:PTH1 family peptidyl-tRNA hydrolase
LQSQFVLGKWKKTEETLVKLKIEKAVEAIETFITAGITTAMNQINHWELVVE